MGSGRMYIKDWLNPLFSAFPTLVPCKLQFLISMVDPPPMLLAKLRLWMLLNASRVVVIGPPFESLYPRIWNILLWRKSRNWSILNAIYLTWNLQNYGLTHHSMSSFQLRLDLSNGTLSSKLKNTDTGASPCFKPFWIRNVFNSCLSEHYLGSI